jgi:putative tricarboxylic transport membrane protein
MIFGGGVLAIQGWREAERAPLVTLLEWIRSPRHVARFFLVIAVMVFYIQVSDSLGFLPTGFFSLFVLMLFLRGVPRWPSSAVISLASVLVIQVFFGQVLRVPLPWGILQNYAW